MARGPGAVLSFETGNAELSEKIVNSTRLWGISMSFGSVNSIIRFLSEIVRGNSSMPCKMSHASIDAETRKSRNMPEDIVRLCVGIEDVRDLIRDLRNAVHPYYSVVNSSSYLWALLRRRLSNICIDPSHSKTKVDGGKTVSYNSI